MRNPQVEPASDPDIGGPIASVLRRAARENRWTYAGIARELEARWGVKVTPDGVRAHMLGPISIRSLTRPLREEGRPPLWLLIGFIVGAPKQALWGAARLEVKQTTDTTLDVLSELFRTWGLGPRSDPPPARIPDPARYLRNRFPLVAPFGSRPERVPRAA